jgi:hypothetical protein
VIDFDGPAVLKVENRRVGSLPSRCALYHDVTMGFQDPVLRVANNIVCLHRKKVVGGVFTSRLIGAPDRARSVVEPAEFNLERGTIRRRQREGFLSIASCIS